MLKVLEHILMTWPTVEPDYRAFNDAIKDLQSESMVELQRLASEMPDHLLVCRSGACSDLHADLLARESLTKLRLGSMRCFPLVRLMRNDLLLTEASFSSLCTYGRIIRIGIGTYKA